jgi:hypothetical protein
MNAVSVNLLARLKYLLKYTGSNLKDDHGTFNADYAMKLIPYTEFRESK